MQIFSPDLVNVPLYIMTCLSAKYIIYISILIHLPHILDLNNKHEMFTENSKEMLYNDFSLLIYPIYNFFLFY